MKYWIPCLFMLISFTAMGTPLADSVYTTTGGNCKIKIALKGGMADVTMDGKSIHGTVTPSKNDKGFYDFRSNGKLVFMFMFDEGNLYIANQQYQFSCSSAKIIELQPACFAKSVYTLPFDHPHPIEKVKWNTLDCQLEGVDEYLCNEEKLRYLSLPDFNDVRVILVPMDCGDFAYYWYLLTVVNNKVIGAEYVEGIWFEPGDESYKEYTNFTIDASYKITVSTTSSKNGGKRVLKSKDVFQLQKDGVLKKL